MNIENLKLLAGVLEDLPEDREHAQGLWVSFMLPDDQEGVSRGADPAISTQKLQSIEGEGCRTSACTAGHGAMSGIPELAKREGESWHHYIERVYGLEPGGWSWDFAFAFVFGGSWLCDTAELARARIEHLIYHGAAPDDWKIGDDWGDWNGGTYQL